MECSESEPLVDDLIARLGGALLDAEEILAVETGSLCPRGKASAHAYVSHIRGHWARGLACVRRYTIWAFDTADRYTKLQAAERVVDEQLAECRRRAADARCRRRTSTNACTAAKERTLGLNAARTAMQPPRLSEAEIQVDEVTVEAYSAVERTEDLFPMVHEITPTDNTVEASISRAFTSDVSLPIQSQTSVFQNEKAALRMIEAALKQ